MAVEEAILNKKKQEQNDTINELEEIIMMPSVEERIEKLKEE